MRDARCVMRPTLERWRVSATSDESGKQPARGATVAHGRETVDVSNPVIFCRADR